MKWFLPTDKPDEKTAAIVRTICSRAGESGGRALLAGGCVRDLVMGNGPGDMDIEIYGMMPGEVKKMLSGIAAWDQTGESFAVLKVRGVPVDVTLPRRETRKGRSHRDFDVDADPFMSPRDAAMRRDFTINAMMYDPFTGELIDFFDGRGDIARRILRHTSRRFSEDALRVLRGMQFAARFDFRAAPETLAACSMMTPQHLSCERVFDEWRKMLLKGVSPSSGLRFLESAGWLCHYPELESLYGCGQDPCWHPEGDVWSHTLQAMDAFARGRTGDAFDDLVVGFAVLCHDFGKPLTSSLENGRIRSRGHAEAGVGLARTFLSRMTNQSGLIDAVIALVENHMCPAALFADGSGDAAIRRLAARVGRIDRLVRVARADYAGTAGCGTDSGVFEAGDWLLARAAELDIKDNAPRPIVMGRHLVALGLEPGPGFRDILDTCYEAQIEGRVASLDDGIKLVMGLMEGGRM